jgi:hypothetical protein
MSQKTATYSKRDQASRERDDHREQRIRWERDEQDSERLVVKDAVTGVVIAIVRSLFDIGRK